MVAPWSFPRRTA